MAIGCVLLGTYAVVFVFWISQSMNVNLPLTYTGYVLSLVPAYFAFHVLRTSTREKLKLITDLKAFDLEGADCRSDYDRDFIFAGITAWYGSKTAFADYVRGPLFDELVRPLSKNQVPNVYWCLLLTPTIGSGLEFLLAIWKGGGPSAVLLSHFIGVVVGMQTLWMLVSLKLGFYLCDRFASLGRVDFTKTLMIFLVFTVCVVFGTALATQAYVESQYLAMAFACGAGLLVFLSFGGWRCIRLSRSTTKNLAL
ncbi:unnamed protein product [Durusdinium trenchii]|uniref:Uncharacterized protein n=1 Tax=Durusdinium trenchii TaxID=1381693 RepID=A0ABP0II72_9DINO